MNMKIFKEATFKILFGSSNKLIYAFTCLGYTLRNQNKIEVLTSCSNCPMCPLFLFLKPFIQL